MAGEAHYVDDGHTMQYGVDVELSSAIRARRADVGPLF